MPSEPAQTTPEPADQGDTGNRALSRCKGALKGPY